MADPSDNEATHQVPLSEVGLENASPRARNSDFTDVNSDEKWQQLLMQQNKNFEMLVRAIKTPSLPMELRLPDFDPDKSDVDARAWISTASLCINDEYRQGTQLMVALSRALKGQASTWLSTVSFPGMTWSDFKELFIQRYDCPETVASFLINLNERKPKENECLATYAASLMTSIMSRWKDLTTEQLAIATVLAHVSRFDRRVQRLSFTTEVNTRNQLQQELKAVSFLKRKAGSDYDMVDQKKTRAGHTSTPLKCFYCGKLGHKSTGCLSKRRDMRRPDDRSNSQQAKNYSSKPQSSATKPAITCFRCQGQGHYALNCTKQRSQGSSSEAGSDAAKQKRVDLCSVSTPVGRLRHSGTSHEDV
ncbi:hypothetical protein PYW08_013598 [Mythimna loreyi]|uniref:Uncharacterized protein n=1 Tax=Mythimna loreyi TaxID=667449 RepID=A0ACC2QIR4_9NEOP|nr:hypothetical protein PYW08_013598 [Mythimna loreyi]